MVAQKPEKKVRSLILSSELYHYAGEFKKAICYSENAHSLINQMNSQEWMAYINRFWQNNTVR
jgi:hypothetical protein